MKLSRKSHKYDVSFPTHIQKKRCVYLRKRTNKEEKRPSTEDQAWNNLLETIGEWKEAKTSLCHLFVIPIISIHVFTLTCKPFSPYPLKQWKVLTKDITRLPKQFQSYFSITGRRNDRNLFSRFSLLLKQAYQKHEFFDKIQHRISPNF